METNPFSPRTPPNPYDPDPFVTKPYFEDDPFPPNMNENANHESSTMSHLGYANKFPLDDLQGALDNIVRVYSFGLTQRKFKREASNAWERRFPTPDKMLSNTFQAFIKENMETVRASNPGMTHQDHMKILGKLWADSKPRLTGVKRTKDD